MDQIILSAYLREVAAQCEFALNAVHHLNGALQLLHSAEGLAEDSRQHRLAHTEVFRSSHSLLTHASNVSRLLWPPSSRRFALERGAKLRETLGITDDNHVLKSRRLRDHLEHFDERLDDWQETSQRRNPAQDNIGPWGSIAGIDEKDVMRWFDPTTKRFIFRGEFYDLQEIVTAIDALIPTAERAAEVAWLAGSSEGDRKQAGKHGDGAEASAWLIAKDVRTTPHETE